MKYNPITPPRPFTVGILCQARTEFKKYNKSDLKSYYDWYQSSVPARCQLLKDAVCSTAGYESWCADLTLESLDGLNRWYSQVVASHARTKEEMGKANSLIADRFRSVVSVRDWDFTLETQSIIIDISMYMGESLINRVKHLEWRHHIDCDVSDIDYGQPIIVGIGKGFWAPFGPALVLATKYINKSEEPGAFKKHHERLVATADEFVSKPSGIVSEMAFPEYYKRKSADIKQGGKCDQRTM